MLVLPEPKWHPLLHFPLVEASVFCLSRTSVYTTAPNSIDVISVVYYATGTGSNRNLHVVIRSLGISSLQNLILYTRAVGFLTCM